MPEYTFFNILYELDQDPYPDSNTFHSIWKVLADPSYKVHQPRGFKMPGLFITYGGTGYLEIPSLKQRVELPPNTVYVINQHLKCYYECPPHGSWDFYFIGCPNPGVFKLLGLKLHQVYRLSAPDLIPHTGESIIAELIHKRPGYPLRTDNLFRELLIATARESRGDKGTGITDLIRWMHYNLDQPLRIGTLMEKSGLGRTLLFSAFKKVTGTSPITFFLNLKLDSARLLLESTDKKIYEIAQALAFYDEYYFSRRFKRRFGLPPGKFRQNIKP